MTTETIRQSVTLVITKDVIQNRINNIEIELAMLKELHDKMVMERNKKEQEFQQQALSNQNRFQQLSGALDQLNKLLNETNHDPSAPDPFERRVSSVGNLGQ